MEQKVTIRDFKTVAINQKEIGDPRKVSKLIVSGLKVPKSLTRSID